MSPRRTILAALTAAALAVLMAFPASAAEAPMLRLAPSTSLEVPRELASSPAVAPIRLNLAALEDVDGRRLSLPLPDGRTLRVERTDVERRGRRDYAWRGRMLNAKGEVNGFVTITVWKDMVQGRIVTPGKIFTIVPAAGRHWIAQAVDSDLPCGTNEGSEVASLAMKSAAAETAPDFAADGFTTLRLVVVYPRASTLGDANRLQLQIRAAVDAANTALANDDISARINLLAIREVNHTESADPVDDLIFLFDNPAMVALRKQFQAPLIDIITINSNVCGIANLMDRDEYEGRAAPVGVSLVRRSCLNDQTLMHELGHNLGAQHDPVNITNPESLLVPYSKGYFVTGSFRTIMSYSTECGGDFGCPRIDHFSNPGATFDGHPVGIPDDRDNARLLRETHSRYAVRTAPGAVCKPGADHLCLLKKRFQVELQWDNQFNGTSGTGRATPRTDSAGFFSFGDPSNLELMVKMLDFGDVVKVFWGQLTNLKYRLIITDMRSGQAKTYQNTPGDCGGIDQGAFSGGTGLDLLAPLPSVSSAGRAVAGCRSSSSELCLDDRFTVSIDWRNPGNGTSGQGVAVPMSKVTGAFHFGDPANLELMAKIIDQGERIDFFWGALSDLEYTLHVTDTATGQVKTYHNAGGHYCGGLEVDAF
ncbi:MAG TPA: zinc-dependent metalloprotease family protein [Thermoanaerobaculia bacterium]|nr:zinc-dependent metalloprotease family protein [Thermoanaerobaculia bacterium]